MRKPYITPDIYVFKVGDDYEIVQNEDGLPKLRINAFYRKILGSKDTLSENAKMYIQEKLLEEKTLKYLFEYAKISEVDKAELDQNMSKKEKI